MIKIILTEEERELLGGYFKTSPINLIRFKSQAILMKEKGLKVKDISGLMLTSQRTVHRWIKGFRERRIASIFSGHQNNENASKLTKEQKQQIKEALSMPPAEYGIPKEFWDVPALREYTRAEFGVVYESTQSYHVLLKFSNLSFKYPDTLDIRRDERLIGEITAEIKREINQYLSHDEWEVFVADETKIMLEAITRRAWLKRGEKTVLKVSKSRECQNYLGVLNQKSFRCHLYELAWQNQEEIIKALKKLLEIYPHKRICIVWDNAKFHKGKKITEEIQKGGALERIHFLSMPPYAPDMNPIEHVWREAKQQISNIQFKDFNQTKKAFKKFIYHRKFHYAI